MTPTHHSTLPSSIWPSFFRSPPPSPESEYSYRIARVPRAPSGYDYSAKFERDYSYPAALAARSPHRSPHPRQLFIEETADSSTPSESESSLQLVRPADGIVSRDGHGDPYWYGPYSAAPSVPISALRRQHRQRTKQRAEHLENLHFPQYFEPPPRISARYPAELQFEKSPSLPSRSTIRGSPGTTFETDSVRFPDLSRLPPTPPGVSLASDLQSSSIRSENLNHPSRPDNLADVSSVSFAPDMNSTFVTSSRDNTQPVVDSLEETINTLIAKINRQAEIIRAGEMPAEHERIGIVRRRSDDFDAETGQMRELH